MIKEKKIKFEYWNNAFLLGSIIYIFIVILKINNLKSSSLDINNLIIDVFGNLNINSRDILINYSNFLYNYIFITYICSNYIEKDFNRNSIYIFTRTDKKNKWFNIKFLRLILFISSYFVIQFILVCIISLISGFKIFNIYNFIILSLCIILNLIIHSTIISLISNIISFKFNEILGYTISISTFSICILLSYMFSSLNNYLKYIPFISSITSWYGSFNSFINRDLNNINFYLYNHIFLDNILINIILIFILQFYTKKIIENMDIL